MQNKRLTHASTQRETALEKTISFGSFQVFAKHSIANALKCYAFQWRLRGGLSRCFSVH